MIGWPGRVVFASVMLTSLVATVVCPEDDPPAKPKEVNFKALLDDPDRPPTNGVQLRTPKAELFERKEGGMGLRTAWEIKYSGKRWPLVIMKPDLERDTNGATRLALYATGKSGKTYVWEWESPRGAFATASSLPEWFLEIPKDKGKAEGKVEVELAPAKRDLLKYYPKEFDRVKAPVLHIRLQHWPRDRGIGLDIDAWTGPLIGPVTKVAADEWWTAN